MATSTVILSCLISFILGWGMGRTLLRMWFRKELEKLQGKVLDGTDKLAANNKKLLEHIADLQKTMADINSGRRVSVSDVSQPGQKPPIQ